MPKARSAHRCSAVMLTCMLALAARAQAVPSPTPAAAPAPARALVVIVSAKSPVTELRRDQVAGIFLAGGNSPAARFPHGASAVAIDQRQGSAQRDAFYSQVAERTPAQMKEHWSRAMFTGRGQPPREARGNAAVLRQVAQNPAFIGYIDRSALNRSVRAVLVVD